MTGARQAVAFLTPLGGARAPSRAALRWFPVIGLALGAALGWIWWGAAQLWPAPVAAALVVAADLGLTGLLHADGLVDSADGLLPPLPRGRRLEVMATPDVGAFGVATAVAVLLLRWAALASTTPDPLLLAALWCASRTAMVITAGVLPYVRSGGLAAPFVGGRWVVTGTAGALATLALGVWWRPLAGPAAVAAAGAGAAVVAVVARRRIGGFTGDVLGAGGMVAETLGLVVAAARW
ncbi:MAG: adenosylcobinamide-GDP ribazoletransferase [Actinomycetota bacterium]|nr:adenosylcobinamide-GDP ribazoletransferase [Actinomycetota bacterium]